MVTSSGRASVLLAVLGLACSPLVESRSASPAQAKTKLEVGAAKELRGSPFVGDFPAGTHGPRYTGSPARGWVVWLTPAKPEEGLHVAEAREGKVLPPRQPAAMPNHPRWFELGTCGESCALAAIVHQEPDGDHLTIYEVTADAIDSLGAVAKGVSIAWVRVLRSEGCTTVVWAEKEPGGARLRAASLGAHAMASPRWLSDAPVLAWQVAQTGAQLFAATLEANIETNVLRLTGIDVTDGTTGPSLTISSDIGSHSGIELSAAGPSLLLSWQRKDGRLVGMPVEKRDGTWVPGAQFFWSGPRGPQKLVSQFSSTDNETWTLWEEPTRRHTSQGSFVLARRVPGGKAELIAQFAGAGLPLLAKAGEALHLFQSEGRPQLGTWTASGSSQQKAQFPWVWDPSCSAQGCVALFGSAEAPHHVELLRVPLSSAQQASWAPAVDDSLSERLLTTASLTSLLAVSHGTDRDLLLSLGDDQPGEPSRPSLPDRLRAPLLAIVAPHTVADTAPELPPASESISLRAFPDPAPAAMPGTDGATLLLWSAPDHGRPLLFASYLGPNGKKLAQNVLWRAGGAIQSIAVAMVDQKVLAFWVETSDNHSQLWMAQVDPKKGRVGQAVALDFGGQPVFEVRATTFRGEVWLAASTEADAVRGGSGLGVARLSLNQTLSAPQWLAAKDSGARTPEWLVSERQLGLLWLEEVPGTQARSHLRLAELERGPVFGAVATLPTELKLDSFGVGCDEGVCTVALWLHDDGPHRLASLTWSPTESPTTSAIQVRWTPSEPALAAIAPAVSKSAIYFATRSDDSRTQIHRLSLH